MNKFVAIFLAILAIAFGIYLCEWLIVPVNIRRLSEVGVVLLVLFGGWSGRGALT